MGKNFISLSRVVGAMCASALAAATSIVSADVRPTFDHSLPARSKDELRLRLREVRTKSEASTRCSGDQVVLLHGYGIPTALAFDVPGYSVADKLAAAGMTAWALDMAGFGESERPASADQGPGEAAPFNRASSAVLDVDRAFRFVEAACPGRPVNLVGWSWGGVVAGAFAAKYPTRVNRLVVLNSMYGFSLPSMTKLFAAPDDPTRFNPSTPAYLPFSPAAIVDQWAGMVKATGLPATFVRDDAAIDSSRTVFMASDPARAGTNTIRRPTGPLFDLFEIWSNRPVYDAAVVRAPLLVIHGDADPFGDPRMVDHFTGTCNRSEVILGDATHYAMLERVGGDIVDQITTFIRKPVRTCPSRSK